MSYVRPIDSTVKAEPVERETSSCYPQLIPAIVIIAAIGAAVVGLISLGSHHGWWSASTLSHLGQIPAILMLAGGSLTTLVCSIVLVCCRSSQTHILSEDFETITTHSDILIESSTHYLQGPIDPLTNMKLGLQVWVAQGSVDEKHGRETCAQRIIDCYQNSSVELNLRDLELRSLPPEIGQLSSLTKLYLSCNQLISLPSEILQLSNLTYLNLSFNKLTCIPREIRELSRLEHLNLSFNKLTCIPREIRELSRLEHLDLASNQLTYLLPEIGQLSRLQFLNLKFNQLTCLPKEAGQLSCLEHLGLEDNRLTSVPPEIWQISSLRYLNLSNNQLTSIPREISQLSSLEILYLGHNRLTSLPSEFCSLSKLTTLDLCKNQLTSIPREIRQLSKLDTLDLQNNQVSCLPSEIGQLSSLTNLRLRNNQLIALPSEIGQLSKLEFLHLDENRLTSLPSEIGQLSSLIYLDLCANRLTSIPREIRQLSKLCTLELQNNSLDYLPSEICQLFSLRHLKLRNNRLTSLPEEILQMRGDLEISILYNELSLRVIQNLQQLMRPPYSGPRIYHSIAEVRQTDNRSLDGLMQELLEVAGQPPVALRNLIDHSENIRKWLVRLSAIGDYKNKRQEFAVMIYQAIVLAEAEADFRDSFLGCIDEAESTCGDRMALSVLRLDVLYKIAKSVREGNLKELAYLLGHGSWALSELETIARNKVPTLRLVDEIEVYLAYPVNLKAALKLPINLDSMLYFACSSVTPQDLSTAETLVKGFLSDQESYLTYLANNATWQKALAQNRKDEYAAPRPQERICRFRTRIRSRSG